METNSEIWKDIPNYEGLYQASNLGRIKSLSDRQLNIRILKQSLNSNGYCQLNLTKNKVHKLWKVHRLIAFTFIEMVDDLGEVNHIDGNKTNNNINNLEWISHSGNAIHARLTGLAVNPKGDKHPKAKLTNSQANEIRMKYSPWKYTMEMLAKEYGIDNSIVCGIIKNKRYATR